MISLTHQLSKLFPSRMVTRIRPHWHRLKLAIQYFYTGGRLKPNWELQCFIARKYFLGSHERMSVAIRSFRELLRWMQFANKDNSFFKWLRSLDKNSVLWDVGASNGLEGFYAHHMTGCHIVFIEPYTPSIESVMKTAYLQNKLGIFEPHQYEIVQAACSDRNSFERLVTHTKPVAGENYNSVEHGIQNYCQGGRQHKKQSITQWVACLPLDDLHFQYGITLPTHLKIDVDGLEMMVLKGAGKILSSSSLKECVVEVNDHHGSEVIELMKAAGFEKFDEFVHCDQNDLYTADYFFSKDRSKD